MAVTSITAVTGLETLPRRQPIDPGWRARGANAATGDATGGLLTVGFTPPADKSMLIQSVSVEFSSQPGTNGCLMQYQWTQTGAMVRSIELFDHGNAINPRSAFALTLTDGLPPVIARRGPEAFTPRLQVVVNNATGLGVTLRYAILLWQTSEEKQLPDRIVSAYL